MIFKEQVTMILNNNIAEDPNFEPKRQWFGHIIALVPIALGVIMACTLPLEVGYMTDAGYSMYEQDVLDQILFKGGSLLIASFFLLALYFPSYIGGNPGFVKLLPLLGGYMLLAAQIVRSNFVMKFNVGVLIIVHLVACAIIVGVAHLIYIKDDSNPKSWCLWIKPWVYKRKEVPFGTQIPHDYPPYGPQGQVPQGYPPQRYPPQGYPQAYPPQGRKQPLAQGHPHPKN